MTPKKNEPEEITPAKSVPAEAIETADGITWAPTVPSDDKVRVSGTDAHGTQLTVDAEDQAKGRRAIREHLKLHYAPAE